jgi:hypothetical protein
VGCFQVLKGEEELANSGKQLTTSRTIVCHTAMENTTSHSSTLASTCTTFKQKEQFLFSQPAGGTRSEAILLFENYDTSGFMFRDFDPEKTPPDGAQVIVYQISCRSKGGSTSNAMLEDTVAEVTLDEAYQRLAAIRKVAGEHRAEGDGGGPDGVPTNGFDAARCSRDEAGPSSSTEVGSDRRQSYSEEGSDDPHEEVSDDPSGEGIDRASSDRSRVGPDKETILVMYMHPPPAYLCGVTIISEYMR